MTSLTAAILIWLSIATIGAADKAINLAAVHTALTAPIASLHKPKIPAEPGPLRDAAARRGLLIGAATEALPLLREDDFADLFATQFNLLTTENRLKFNIVHPQRDRYDFTQADAIVRFAEANNILVRGHCFIWHEHFPSWLESRSMSTTEAQRLLQEHIRTVMRHYNGRVKYWDVINEPIADNGTMRDTKWRRLLGDDYIALALRWAREADPDAKLFINDFGAETICPKSDKLLAVLRDLQARKVPLDGVGFQMHLNLAAGLSTASLQQNLKRFAALGLEMHVTEMDVSLNGTGVTTETLRRQAGMYHDVLETVLKFPQVKAIVFWGASDRHSWLTSNKQAHDAPLLFDRELQPKPAYYAVVSLLRSDKAQPQKMKPVKNLTTESDREQQ